ncbi:hypothetical protein HNY42_08330 [Exiguobacterium sp. Helios]|uniref:hypothetical protein n=1 Tax=Exiguobacterium sp. Helios TaxID=2735868 RepID=UPI00165E59B4|nr:hypothetical protein [Exiguobacterium sp. Helios]QNR20941.1 hypothetical protein HNY42_08330 [Exiguobacterium sp. Helios]
MQIYIEEKPDHAKTIKEYHIVMKGQDRLKTIFSVEYYNEDSNEDEIITDEEVLTQLFTRLNRFPVYLSFGLHELTDSGIEDVISTVKQRKLLYTQTSINKRETYMMIEVNQPEDLLQVLEKSLSLASYNGYYLISLTKLLKFETRSTRRWFVKKERLVPVVDMTEPTTFLKIGFDFENVLIFSNEAWFDALEKIEAFFPEDEIEQ